MQHKAGVLYVVGTPIGNLEDITLRALRTLKEVDLIACEDTRQTRKLLDHHGISTRTISYYEHNEAARAAELVERLEQGASIALVSDAGMPGVSDPGYRVIKLAAERGIVVVPIPGPAAFVSALAASGLPTDEFRFHGFLPAKSGERRDLLSGLRNAQETQIFYEAPHRLLETLQDVVEIMGPERRLVVARELTKIHEEFIRGQAAEVLRVLQSREGKVRGEITLLIGRAEAAQAPVQQPDVRKRLRDIQTEQGIDEKAALKAIAKELGISKSEAYRRLQRAPKRS
ncbi:MAG: 16S rRNA (cytidine(1402)-2'-O)-methyltransferase [Acidobacteriales bacterium]|nr:16S rRNA (cytidine(1402)-2'-O)-methyltransferase [Terriglobales bacterium]